MSKIYNCGYNDCTAAKLGEGRTICATLTSTNFVTRNDFVRAFKIQCANNPFEVLKASLPNRVYPPRRGEAKLDEFIKVEELRADGDAPGHCTRILSLVEPHRGFGIREDVPALLR
jgi:hypothetical protein